MFMHDTDTEMAHEFHYLFNCNAHFFLQQKHVLTGIIYSTP